MNKKTFNILNAASTLAGDKSSQTSSAHDYKIQLRIISKKLRFQTTKSVKYVVRQEKGETEWLTIWKIANNHRNLKTALQN